MQKETFVQYLRKTFPDTYLSYLDKFETYYQWLIAMNQKVNLISRRTDPQEVWSWHFLDSLLAEPCVDFAGKRILDFGTGGGLPGIPLAIVHPDASVVLLDATHRKTFALKSAIAKLGLKNCQCQTSRLEKLPAEMNETFDRIVCRSVRILPEFKKPLMQLLAPGGKLVLYKSRELDDVNLFEGAQLHKTSHPVIGERTIVIIDKQ
jgi:16S rRNA (guanine527-N7)-methyltransferase